MTLFGWIIYEATLATATVSWSNCAVTWESIPLYGSSCWSTYRARKRSYFCQNRTWMCLPILEKLTFSTPIICPITHPSVYCFPIEKHPSLPKLGDFYNNMLKIHPILSLGSFVSDNENPPIAIPISQKNTLKTGTYMCIFHVNTECINSYRPNTPPYRSHRVNQSYKGTRENFAIEFNRNK